MKLRELHIFNYKQFEEIKLDLYYPKGHVKEGKALDKVCFIGQSGTGKTNILHAIMHMFVSIMKSKNDIEVFDNDTRIEASFEIKVGSSFHVFDKILTENQAHYAWNFQNIEKVDIDDRIYKDRVTTTVFGYRKKQHIYYFPAQADQYIAKEFYENIVKSAAANKGGYSDFFLDQVVYCHYDTLYTVNKIMADLVKIYNDNEHEARIKATYEAEKSESFSIKKYLDNWRKNNPSPLNNLFTSGLVDLLNDMNLKVNFSNTDSSDDVFNSIFKSNNLEKSFAFKDLSSGVRQLVLMMFPLIVRQPKRSVIIIDEPETSLFPTVQSKIIEMYTGIGDDNQYFTSTHSPIVAASFDPAERFYFELSEGNITVQRGISPEGDDPNDLLVNDFKLDTPLGVKGEEKYREFLDLRRKLSVEIDDGKKQLLANEIMQINQDYNFDF